MGLPVEVVSAEALRRLTAAAILGGEESPGTSAIGKSFEMLGPVTLHPHQTHAVRRINAAIAEIGGALLCDEVGMGKTYVALAVAVAQRAIVVAPANLRDMWSRQSALVGVPISFVSFESLSRGRPVEAQFDLVIVDEAHHVRNPATRRYREVSRIAARSRVVLLSATPIHNRRDDLTALLSIFLGSRAASLSPTEIGQCVIRRQIETAGLSGQVPEFGTLVWKEVADDDVIPSGLMSLPPPMPPRDGGDGGALVARSLLRQWCSSDAALESALRRRLARSIALSAALESGHYPSKRELTAWTVADDSIQLAFPSLVATPLADATELLEILSLHREALRRLLSHLEPEHPRDAERARLLMEIRQSHPEMPIVAFSQYAETVRALFRELRSEPGVAALTSKGARVAGGMLTRREAIARFAPRATGVPVPRDSERIGLLLSTDLLSEGVNLQDAGVVVHLDLPWTPARIEQRMGRVARLGSSHHRVYAYGIRPHAASEALIRMEETIRAKMSAAAHHVGAFRPLLPAAPVQSGGSDDPHEAASAPTADACIRAILRRWRMKSPNAAEIGLPLRHDITRIAAVTSDREGFVALLWRHDRYSLLACDRGLVTESPATISRLLPLLEASAVIAESGAIFAAKEAIQNFLLAQKVTYLTQPGAAVVARARRLVLRRISAIVQTARPHMRAHLLDLVRAARRATLGRLGAAVEDELVQLASSNLPDEAWLTAIERHSAMDTARAHEVGDSSTTPPRIAALFLLVPSQTALCASASSLR